MGWLEEKEAAKLSKGPEHGSEVLLYLADHVQSQFSGPISPKTPNDAPIGYPYFIVKSTEVLSGGSNLFPVMQQNPHGLGKEAVFSLYPWITIRWMTTWSSSATTSWVNKLS